MLLSVCAWGQGPLAGILDRYTDPEKGHVVFIAKGNRAMGIGGSYQNFGADGYVDGDGYSILSLLNIGDGGFSRWSVTPSASWFVADDVSLGVNLSYNGYLASTNLNLDFREILPQLYEVLGEKSDAANVTITARHMEHHAWGVGFAARKYFSFFGSRTVGLFGEGRAFLKYGNTFSCPRNAASIGKTRFSQVVNTGVQIAGGIAIRLRDNSAITISVPIFGVAWNATWQDQVRRYKKAIVDAEGKSTGEYEIVEVPGGGRMTSFKAARAADLTGLQFGYVRYIEPKKKK